MMSQDIKPEPLPNSMALVPVNAASALLPESLGGGIITGGMGDSTRFHPRYAVMSDGAMFDKVELVMIERDQLEANGFMISPGNMIVNRETGEIIGSIPRKRLEPLTGVFNHDPAPVKASAKVAPYKPPRPLALEEFTDLDLMSQSRLTSEESELFEMLTTCRDADSETELAFISKFIDTLPGVERDSYGNRYVRVGENPRLAFSSHTDSVHYIPGTQAIVFDKGVISLAKHSDSNCLGADCATGVWLMRHMILAGVPGLYLFHRKEESGMQGSRWIVRENREALDGIKAVIAFDRMGFSSVITHQMGERTCSKAFAQSFIKAIEATNTGSPWTPLEYRIDTGGAYTDSYAYADFIPECTNISVGYHNQHSSGETQNVDHATRLLRALRVMDWDSLAIDREPGTVEYNDDWGRGRVYKGRYGGRYLGLGPAEGYGQHGAWHDPQYDPWTPTDDAGRSNPNYEEAPEKQAMSRLQKEREIITQIVAEYPEEIADLIFYDWDKSPEQVLTMLAEQCGLDPDDVLYMAGFNPENPYEDSDDE